MLNFLFLIVILTFILLLGYYQGKLIKERGIRYRNSKRMLMEHPDNPEVREGFFRDAHSYYNALYLTAVIRSNDLAGMSSRLKLWNDLTGGRMNQHLRESYQSKVSENYYRARPVINRSVAEKIRMQILDICSNSQEYGASIIDFVIEFRKAQTEITPIIERLLEDELIVANTDRNGTVVYRLR